MPTGILGQFLSGAGGLLTLPGNVINAYATAYRDLPQQYRDAAALRQIKLDEARAMAPLRREAAQGLFGAFAPSGSPAPAQSAPEATTLPVAANHDPASVTLPAPVNRVPTIRELAGPLARASLAGLDVSDLVNVLDKTAPQIDVANGVAYDKRGTAPGSRIGVNLSPVNGTLVDPNDPKNVDRYIPKIPDGADYVYDRQGNPVGVKMIDGVIQALGQAEAAASRGRAEGEAPYRFIQAPAADGSTALVSQDQLVRNLLPPGVGRSQTPAEKITSEGLARRDVDVATTYPKAAQSMATLNRTTDQVLEAIDKALEQTSQASAGLGSLTAFIPGSPAKNLDAILDTIKANVGFDRLDEMRANSPTGGALGSITERELALLSSVAGSLNQGQSPAQLQENLQRIRSSLARVREQRMSAFEQQYGGGGQKSSAPASGGYSREALEAEARRRGIL